MLNLGRCSWFVGCLSLVLGCGGGKPDGASKTANVGGAGGQSSGVAGGQSVAGQSSIVNPCGAPDATLPARNGADLFAYPKVPTFDLVLPPAAWEALKVNARDEQYIEAQACFEGQAIGLVGLRFKGSYGSLYNCFDSAGVNTCRKLGMKVKFDKYDPDLRFYGLKRLNFHGYRYDDSYIKERLSYDLYASMDIVAPKAAWAVLRVNGESQGLFGMVEDIDGRFTESRWPGNGNGNLYKELWPGTADDAMITSRLETNEDLAQIANFKAFSAAMTGAPPEQLRNTFSGYADLAYWARYMAVDDAIANYDGITTYYTWSGDSGNHNFFLYEEAANRYTIVPWDLESTLSTASGFGYVPPWQTTPTDCSLTYRSWMTSDLRVIAPGCDPVFRALSADLTTYHAEARRLLDGPFAEATMLSNIDRLASFIRAEATADPHGPGAQKFESALTFLRQDIPKLRNRLEFLQTGKTTVPIQASVGQFLDFEANDDYGLTVGTMLMCNANSTTSVAIEKTTPIAGNQSLRIAFNFANEAKAWQQWAVYQVPLTEGPKDLNALTGIRFKARSNVARSLRFDIVSPNDSGNNDGIHFGWDVSLKPEVTQVEVLFAKAKIPGWAEDLGDVLTDSLGSTTSLSFQPICNYGVTGMLPEGTTDNGWIDVDDLEFF